MGPRFPIFWHNETFPLFSALLFHVFRKFFYYSKRSPSFFDILQQSGCSKNPNGPPFTFFSNMRHTGDFKKTFENKFGKFFPQFLVFWDLLLSPVVEKVVFESYWALDMAPTWPVPGLFQFSIQSQFLNRTLPQMNHQNSKACFYLIRRAIFCKRLMPRSRKISRKRWVQFCFRITWGLQKVS